ncbi:hypothetical protein HZS_608 [Henneguya salminicola]|nr:hypothetical protein HZS_608 [Henneguya salminicola]
MRIREIILIFHLLVCFYTIFSQDVVTGPIILTYREMTISLYGEPKERMRNNEYDMIVKINQFSAFIISPIAIDSQNFRVDEQIADYVTTENEGDIFKVDILIPCR